MNISSYLTYAAHGTGQPRYMHTFDDPSKYGLTHSTLEPCSKHQYDRDHCLKYQPKIIIAQSVTSHSVLHLENANIFVSLLDAAAIQQRSFHRKP
jgi:hypothetical protein